jgi:hypothetical protein
VGRHGVVCRGGMVCCVRPSSSAFAKAADCLFPFLPGMAMLAREVGCVGVETKSKKCVTEL